MALTYTPPIVRDWTATDGQQALTTRDLYPEPAALAFIKEFQSPKGTILTVTGGLVERRWKVGYRRLRGGWTTVVLYDVD